MDQAAERYLTRLRRSLVCPKKEKERLLAEARDLLENFAQENPGAFYQDYVASFGQPEDFAGEMLSGLDPEVVAEARLRRKRALMGTVAAAAVVLVLLVGIWLGQRSRPAAEVPTPTPPAEQTATPTPEPTATPTPEPTATPTPEPTATPTPEPTATPTPEPTATPTPEPTATPTPEPTATPTPEPTATPTPEPTPTPTPTPEPTPTVEPSPEPTGAPASGPVTFVEGQFTRDYTEITHKEAVGTVVALKLMHGKEDGSYFDPTGNVTKAEVTKFIAVMMNGGIEVNTGAKEEPSFTDIQGHWAEGWIEYCADMRIIGPWESEEFDPNANITSLEMLRMCLTALGYDAEAYHLIGENWMAQTFERAINTKGRGLLQELDKVDFNLPVTRDDAAQILYNTLLATPVTTIPQVNTASGEVTWQYKTDTTQSDGTPETLLHVRFNKKKLSDISYVYPDF